MTEISVKVAVRVRPWNDREKQMQCKLAVEMPPTSGNELPNTTVLKDLDDTGAEKQFTFDYSFWSHDGFVEDEKTGLTVPDVASVAAGGGGGKKGNSKPVYASQQTVYDKLGVTVLNNAWEGYHCCLFAYGQTGAGKSYSMVGYGANKGIVPLACDEIFQRIDKNKDKNLEYDVVVSMLEIYNEKVQDLLIHPNKRPVGGLEIRESKELGVYVANLTKCKVTSYKEIDQIMEQGIGNRTIGSTLMNATSSRAHTVLGIELKQLSHVGDRVGTKMSVIYLVDLAGSEKAAKTGATGDRLKEGSAINKSLSCLGNVIEKLADACSGKVALKNIVIPYRDSKLTRLLQNALGGSSFTVMICAISPASNNYQESLSTLRYADRAKKIKNQSVVNEDPQDKIIRQLREENAKLREMVEQGGGVQVETKTVEKLVVDEAAMGKAKEKHEKEIKALEDALIQMQQDFFKKLQEEKNKKKVETVVEEKEIVTVKEIVVQEKIREKHLDLPHISNLHEDPMLAGKLHYSFPPPGKDDKDDKTEWWLGRQVLNENWKPHVVLAGVGIQKKHCRITSKKDPKTKKNVVTLFVSDKTAIETTFVNGDNFFFEGGEGCELTHGDRLIIGQNYVFVYIDPATFLSSADGKTEYCNDLIDAGKCSYELAKKELAEKQGDLFLSGQMNKDAVSSNQENLKQLEEQKKLQLEYEEKLKQAEQKKQKAQEEMLLELKKKEEEYQQELLRMQKQMAESELSQELNQEKKQESELKKMELEYKQRKKQIELKNRREIYLIEKKQRMLALEEKLRKDREQDIAVIEELLTTNVPLCKEATALSLEMNKGYSYHLRLNIFPVTDMAGKSLRSGGFRLLQPSVLVVCKSAEGDQLFEWDADTLENRVFLMRELFDHWCLGGQFDLKTLPVDRDPFWDPVTTEYFIGSCRVYLEPLIYGCLVSVDAKLLGPEGKPADAYLRVELERKQNSTEKSNAGDKKYDSIEELEDECDHGLTGGSFSFKIKVAKLRKLDAKKWKNPRVEFQYYVDEKTVVRPKRDNKSEFIFDYSKTVKQDPVTERYLEYLRTGVLTFSVFAFSKHAIQLDQEQQTELAERQDQTSSSPDSKKKKAEAAQKKKTANENEELDASTSGAGPMFFAEQSRTSPELKGNNKSLADMANEQHFFVPSPDLNRKRYEVLDKNRDQSQACVIL
ncbi:unnamed protein product [Amoebophrya sp. A120]|nr:unnamed protein product [Amoebophrya sp. A120]|eukprot:GSA120T00025965001.1